jgi:hypothetical protein
MSTITTVIPVYNGEKHLAETLESLARQTRRPDRVVLVDDGSTDRTEEIARNFSGIRCDWRPNPRNLGLFPNHNSALRFAAETTFLHILHANDSVSPTFFEKLVPLIENAPGFALAYGGHVFVEEDGSETARKESIGGSEPRRISTRAFLEGQSELKAILVHSAVMKTDGQRMPCEFRLDIPQSADVVFHSEFAARCSQIWAHPDILCQVRLHEGSASSKNSRSLQAWVVDEWRTIQMVYDIMKGLGLGSWTREQKLKLLFAARCHVKMKIVAGSDPAYAREIKKMARTWVGPWQWRAAGGVVAARDRFFPNPHVYRDGLQEKEN